MKNRINRYLAIPSLLVVIFAASTVPNLNAQSGTTYICPSGDDYTCYTISVMDGLKFEFKKGEGDTIIIEESE